MLKIKELIVKKRGDSRRYLQILKKMRENPGDPRSRKNEGD